MSHTSARTPMRGHALSLAPVAAGALVGSGCAAPAEKPKGHAHPGTEDGSEADSALDEEDDTGDGPEPGPYDAVITDLVSIHQDLFDRYVLFYIDSGDDFEYPTRSDDDGPATVTFAVDSFPNPDILGTVQMTIEMAEDGDDDLWTMALIYGELSATPSLSEGTRPVLRGQADWSVRSPGRHHSLDAGLSIDGADPVPVQLDFSIIDYVDLDHLFGVTGSIAGEVIETSVRARGICTSWG